jgi:hypothetical protein
MTDDDHASRARTLGARIQGMLGSIAMLTHKGCIAVRDRSTKAAGRSGA